MTLTPMVSSFADPKKMYKRYINSIIIIIIIIIIIKSSTHKAHKK